MDLKSHIRTVLDHPKPGIRFRDITTVLNQPEAFQWCNDQFYQRYQNTPLDAIAAIESRGFLFGSVLAHLLGVPLVPVRKPGKLPGETVTAEYLLEYGSSQLELHADALAPGSRVVVIDDLIATGGTLGAVIHLLGQLQVEAIECSVVVELTDLNGRQLLPSTALFSLVSFHEHEF